MPRSCLGDRCCCSTRCGQARWPPNPALLARDAYVDMMKTAQNVADRYELTREEIDAFALRSHQHAAAARDSGRFAEEISPVEIPANRKEPARTSSTTKASATTPRREARCPPGAAEHDPDDRRQLLTPQRRLERGRPRQRGGRRSARSGAAGARGGFRDPRAGPAGDGIAPAFAIPKASSGRPGPGGDRRLGGPRGLRSVALAILRELPNQLAGFEVPTTASTRMAGPWPSAIHSARRAPATCSRWRRSSVSASFATASSASASDRARESHWS